MDTTRWYVIYYRDVSVTEAGAPSTADIETAWSNAQLPSGATLGQPSGRKVTSCMRVTRTTESLGAMKVTEAVGILEAPEGSRSYQDQWADAVADNFTGQMTTIAGNGVIGAIQVRLYSPDIDATQAQIANGDFCASQTRDRFPSPISDERYDEDPLKPDMRTGTDWWKFGLGIGVGVFGIAGIGILAWKLNAR